MFTVVAELGSLKLKNKVTVDLGKNDKEVIMNIAELAIRTDKENDNHHLWNNNGTWFIHYTVYPTAVTKKRIRRSLKTKSLDEARRLRDEIFLSFEIK